MKNHWQASKFLPFQKILSPTQINWLSLNYHKLMSKILINYEVNEPKVSSAVKVQSNIRKIELENITGLKVNNMDILNLNKSFGNYFTDIDGNNIMDLSMNNGRTALGYNHRNIIRNTKFEKYQRYSIQSFINAPSSEYVTKVLRELHKLAPVGCEEVLLANNETNAIEMAVRLANYSFLEKNPHQKNKDFKVLSFEGGNYQQNTVQIPFPNLKYPYNEFSEENLEAEKESIKLFGQIIEEIYSDNEMANAHYVVPAIIIEPIMMKAEVKYASPYFYKNIMKLCENARIKVIIDEIETCGWVTGRLFSYYQWVLEQSPDIVVFGGRMSLSGLYYNRNIISTPSEIEEKGFRFSLSSTPNMLDFERLMTLKYMVYDIDWLDLHCSNFYSSMKTEFDEIREKACYKVLNPRGKGKIFAFDVDHRLIRDEIVCKAIEKGYKFGIAGEKTIVFTPSLLFTEIHFTPIKDFLISVVPSSQFISKV